MGVSESKVWADRVSARCEDAERNRNGNCQLINKPEIMSVLQDAWASMPIELTTAIMQKPTSLPAIGGNVVTHPQEINETSEALKANSTKKRKPDKPHTQNKRRKPLAQIPTFNSDFDKWTLDPLSFIFGAPHDPQQEAITSLYKSLLNLQTKGLDLVRERLLKVLFHRCKSKYSFPSSKVGSRDLDAISRVIAGSGAVESSLDVVKTNTSKWVKEGKRIESLCKDMYDGDTSNHKEYFYLGNLFRLLHVSKEDIRTLKMEGDERMEKIMALNLSVPEEVRSKDFYNLAHRVFQELWNKVEDSFEANPHLLQKGLDFLCITLKIANACSP
ncbi:hypothetical protein BJX76DRAFT_152702 [Aspergillus varians]